MVDGGRLDVPDETIPEMLLRVRDKAGGYAVRDGDAFVTMPWSKVYEEVNRLAAGLIDAGIQAGDRVALLGDTSREWCLAAHAIHAAGAVLVPIYPTLPPDVTAMIADDAGAKLCIAEDETQAAKVSVETHLFGYLEVLAEKGDEALAADPELVTGRANEFTARDLACIVYTSGTTGIPKGVCLTHRHWTASTMANVQGLGLDKIPDPSILAFLPMAHVAGFAAAMALTHIGGTVAFSRPDRMAQDFPMVRPTMLIAVPRLYERIMAKIRQTIVQGSKLKRILFEASERVAMRAGETLENGGQVRGMLAFRHSLFELLIYRKLRAKLGFDRVQVGLTGAAAVRPDLLYFLQGIGLNIVEAYGMTETTGLVTTNHFERFKAGSVGRPMAGTRVRLDHDGEILIAGDMVFQGYWGRPEETAENMVELDGDSWLRTGDIGTIDGDGYLSIIDRKKELEILDTGKMVAPVRVEELLKSETHLVEDSILLGNGQKYAAMLIQPAFDALIEWASQNGVDAPEDVVRKADPTGEVRTYTVPDAWLNQEPIRAVFQAAVDRTNGRLADFEQIREFRLIPDAFTVDAGELTPTFKKRRKAILARWDGLANDLFKPLTQS